MVMKEYCDECGKELKSGENVVSDRITLKTKTGYEFQVIIANKEKTWNAGSLCLTCVKKLFSEAKLN